MGLMKYASERVRAVAATSRSNKITFIKQSKQNKIISISNNFIKKKDRTTKITEVIDKENKLVIILWTLS